MRQALVGEIGQAEAPSAPARADLAPSVALGDDGQRQAHQRPHIGRQQAVGARDQHRLVLGGQPGHHLHHGRVLGARHALDALQQGHLGAAVEAGDRVLAPVELQALGVPRQHLDALALSGGGDRAHRGGAVVQRRLAEGIGVGKGGLLAHHGAHPHPLIDAEAAALDDALFQAPTLRARGLEVQIGIVNAMCGDQLQCAAQAVLIEVEGRQQAGLRGGQVAEHEIGSVHAAIVFHRSSQSFALVQ
jgi:hypothetical protein